MFSKADINIKTMSEWRKPFETWPEDNQSALLSTKPNEYFSPNQLKALSSRYYFRNKLWTQMNHIPFISKATTTTSNSFTKPIAFVI